MKPDDFPEFSFDHHDGNLLIGTLSETDAKDYLLAFPVGSIRVFPNAFNFYLCAQLKELGSRALVENNVLLANWGHSNNSADSGSRRWYAGRREFVQNLEAKNKVKLALTLQQQQASQYEVEVRNENLVIAHGDLGRSFFAWDDSTLKLQFEHFAWLISCLCNWDIDAGMHCLQFNYQHCPFAPMLMELEFSNQS